MHTSDRNRALRTPHPTRAVRVQALLRERPWLEAQALASITPRDLAFDMLQETWSSALAHPPADLRNPRAWLRRVLRNHLHMHWRREGRLERVDSPAEDWVDPRAPGCARLERREHQLWVAAHLEALPEPFRSTLELRYYRDHTPTQIARHQGIPAGTVRWRLSVGLRRMRHRLSGRGTSKKCGFGGDPGLVPPDPLAPGPAPQDGSPSRRDAARAQQPTVLGAPPRAAGVGAPGARGVAGGAP